MDTAERSALTASLSTMMATVSGGALDRAMADFGWVELLTDLPDVAIPAVFEQLGWTGAHAPLLNDVVLDAAGRKLGGTVPLPYAGGAWVVWDRADDGPSAALDSDLPLRQVEAGDPVPLAAGRVALGWWLLGTGRAMLDLARAHALERLQFGRPIASFQAVHISTSPRSRQKKPLAITPCCSGPVPVVKAAWLGHVTQGNVCATGSVAPPLPNAARRGIDAKSAARRPGIDNRTAKRLAIRSDRAYFLTRRLCRSRHSLSRRSKRCFLKNLQIAPSVSMSRIPSRSVPRDGTFTGTRYMRSALVLLVPLSFLWSDSASFLSVRLAFP